MEVWDWGPFLRRRFKTILSILVLTILVTMAVSYMMPPTYRSTAILNVQPITEDQVLAYPTASQMVARNVGELIKSPQVTNRAAKILDKSELEGVLDYRVPEDGSLIEVTVDYPSPQGAADEANAIARAFIEYNTEASQKSIAIAQASLEKQIDSLRAQIAAKQGELAQAREDNATDEVINGVQDEIDALQTGYEAVLSRWQALPSAETLLATSVSIVNEALPDSEVVSPRPLLNLLLAIIGGLLFGIGVAAATEPRSIRQSSD